MLACQQQHFDPLIVRRHEALLRATEAGLAASAPQEGGNEYTKRDQE
jgi:hypothetical protein